MKVNKNTNVLDSKQRGTYLLTGGLGGIGTEIAAYLLEHYQARLILVGRTHLPENASAITTKLERYHRLQQLSGSVWSNYQQDNGVQSYCCAWSSLLITYSLRIKHHSVLQHN